MPAPLLWRAELRFLLRHPLTVGFAVLGIALGVAVAIAVDLAARGAVASFVGVTARMDGTAVLRVVGDGPTLDVARHAGVVQAARALGLQATPVVRGPARLGARRVNVLGVDVLTADAGGGEPTWGLARFGAAEWLAGRLALATADVAPGAAAIELVGAGGSRSFDLPAEGRIVEDALQGRAVALVVVDLAAAQSLLGLEGRLSSIDLQPADWNRMETSGAALAQALRASLAAAGITGLEVRRVDADRDGLHALTAAFRFNLQALSWLAVLVGVLLAHQLYAVLCERRLRQQAQWRALGLTRGELVGVQAVETVLLVALGALAGIVAGVLLAQVLVTQIGPTVSGPARVDAVAATRLDARALLGTLPVIAAALAGMGLAARRLLQATPQALWLQQVEAAPAGLRALARPGLALLLPAAAVLCLGLPGYLPAMAAIAAVVIAVQLVLPAFASRALQWIVDRWPRRHAPITLPLRQSRRGRRELQVGLGALVVALGVAAGMGLMIDSFRVTLVNWLDDRLGADLYLRLGGAHEVARLQAELERLGARSIEWHFESSVHAGLGPERLELPIRLVRQRQDGAPMPAPTLAGALRSGALAIGEPLALAQGIGVGDTLWLPGPDGPRAWPVSAVIRDFSLGRIRVVQPGAAAPRPGEQVVVSVDTGGDQGVLAAIEAALASLPGIETRRNREILAISLQIFEQTFAITRSLELIALAIAALALVTATVLEHQRHLLDLGRLRALGMTRRELGLGLLLQAMALAAVAVALAAPLGVIVGWLLVARVNPGAFGWTLEWTVSASRFGMLFLLALAAAAVALLPMARRLWLDMPARLMRRGLDAP